MRIVFSNQIKSDVFEGRKGKKVETKLTAI